MSRLNLFLGQPRLRRLLPAMAILTGQFALGLPVVATLCATTTASAQFGGNTGFAEAFKPDYYSRDIQLFNDYLDLEEWQRPIIETLLADYGASFQAGMDAMKEQMAAKKDDIASRGAAGILPVIDAWTKEKARLRQEFIDNVKSQLSAAQQARWPRFERAFRRDKTLHLGELSGESVNIFVILKEISLDSAAQAAVEPLVEQFEQELDEALKAREEMMAAQQPKIQDAMISMDTDAGVAAVEKITATRIRVRDANDRAADAIANALPENARAEFVSRWRNTAYSRVFRASPMERVFHAIDNLSGLTDDQKAAVAKVRASFEQQNDALSVQALTILRAEEPKEFRRKAESGRGKSRPSGKGPDFLASITEQRDTLNESTRVQLDAILGEELASKIPNLAKARAAQEAGGASSKTPADSDRRIRVGGGKGATNPSGGTSGGRGAQDSKSAD